MSDQKLAQGQAAAESILIALDVDRVISVDDANGSVQLEDVIAAAQSLEESQLLASMPELGESFQFEPDILSAKIREIWASLDPAEQAGRGLRIVAAANLVDGDETNDLVYASILGQLIPEEKLVILSPAQWEEQKERLLEDSKRERMLFLFDQNFSNTGGDSEAGIKIISSLLSGPDTEKLICGLLTHTVTPETQPQQWEALSSAHSIPRDRFILIPKLYLSKAPIMFARTLKFVALSPDFTELKSETKKIITDAAADAASRVEKVSIYDLDHIVFQVSTEEGLWEPDMLFRLHAMFHRLESRRLAHLDGKLEAIAANLRAVSSIPTKCDEIPIPRSAWALQREELYEFEEHLNHNYLPLELGDIFKRTSGESIKKYILLSQPCDLMVRGSGKRQPELHRVPLVEVVIAEKAPNYSEEMPYFDSSPEKKWFVKFKAVHFVRSCILDLCVFNKDGTAKWRGDGTPPFGIRPSWRERHEILASYWKKIIKKTEIVTPEPGEPREVALLKKKVATDMNGILFNDDLFKGSLVFADGVHEISYNCKRVGRLSRARAIGLLMSYTATIGRPAYDRDFGR